MIHNLGSFISLIKAAGQSPAMGAGRLSYTLIDLLYQSGSHRQPQADGRNIGHQQKTSQDGDIVSQHVGHHLCESEVSPTLMATNRVFPTGGVMFPIHRL